jgi:segregation and condensation protein B
LKEINLFDDQIETISVGMPGFSPVSHQAKLSTELSGIAENIQAAQRAQQQEKFVRQHAKHIIEALLFASNQPLSFFKMREIVETFHSIKPRLLRDLIDELQQEYVSQQRAFRLEEIAHGFLLRTCEEYGRFIDLLYRNKRSERLSSASTEVLAIIAYRQPITRAQIDAIRGVDCSGIIQNLLERSLIEAIGRQASAGKPTLYGITKGFLKHFGLRDLQDLPAIKDT